MQMSLTDFGGFDSKFLAVLKTQFLFLLNPVRIYGLVSFRSVKQFPVIC